MVALAIGIGLAVAATAISATSAAVSASQQNAQLEYQQKVAEQNKIAAQNKAAAEMKMRRSETLRQQGAARAKMAAMGTDSQSGSFLDLIGQGAAAGELDVLKAKYDGDAQVWALNNKINELETQKHNVGLEATLAGASTAVKSASSLVGAFGGGGGGGAEVVGKTSGNSGFKGVDAMEGTIA